VGREQCSASNRADPRPVWPAAPWLAGGGGFISVTLEGQRTVRPDLKHERVWTALMLARDKAHVHAIVTVPVHANVGTGATNYSVGAAFGEPEQAGHRVMVAGMCDPLMPDDQAAVREAEDVLVVGDGPVDPFGVDRPEAEHDRFGVLPRVGAKGQEALDRRAPGRLVRASAALRNRGRDGEECPEKNHGQCHHRPSSVTWYRLHGDPPILARRTVRRGYLTGSRTRDGAPANEEALPDRVPARNARSCRCPCSLMPMSVRRPFSRHVLVRGVSTASDLVAKVQCFGSP